MKGKNYKLSIAMLICIVFLVIELVGIIALVIAASPKNKREILWADDSNLSVEMNVVTEQDSYVLTGKVKWKEPPPANKKYIKNKSFDFISIGWGGDGALALMDKSKDMYVYGEYLNGEEIYISHRESDSYGGFVWQFNEISDSGSPINFVEIKLRICRLYELQGKETDVKMSYNHTFDVLNRSVSPDVLNGGKIKIIFNSVEKFWVKEIPRCKIKY